MIIRRYVGTSLLLTAVVGCQGTESVVLESDDQKASYVIGHDVGTNLAVARSQLDLAALQSGIEDALAEQDSRVTEEEAQRVMTAFQESIEAAMQAESEAEASANVEVGLQYLEENAAREGVVTTDSGLQYEVLEEGDGPRPGPTDQVRIHYRGTLVDGTEFDSSYERGEPAVFGVNAVIPGFSEGLQLMPVGSHYRFVIPSELAYGPAGSPPAIGPSATLVFEVEMLEIPEA